MDRANFVCPICKKTVLAPTSLVGHSSQCPKCGNEVASWPPPSYSVKANPSPSGSRYLRTLALLLLISLIAVTAFFAGSFYESSRSGSVVEQVQAKRPESESMKVEPSKIAPKMLEPEPVKKIDSHISSTPEAKSLPKLPIASSPTEKLTDPKDWTNRELHRFLVGKGIECDMHSKTANSLIFCPKDMSYNDAKTYWDEGVGEDIFVVIKHSNQEQARRSAESVSEKISTHHWSVYSFAGHEKIIKQIKTALTP